MNQLVAKSNEKRLLFAVLLWRGIRAGLRAKDTFGRFLAWGFSANSSENYCNHTGV